MFKHVGPPLKLRNLALGAVLAIALVGCAKPLPAEKIAYAGTWTSADSRVNITITPEGRVEYSNEQPGKSSSVSAPIKSFDGDNFDAGIGPLSTEFKVTQPPKQDAQGNWFMIIDGHTLAKVQ